MDIQDFQVLAWVKEVAEETFACHYDVALDQTLSECEPDQIIVCAHHEGMDISRRFFTNRLRTDYNRVRLVHELEDMVVSLGRRCFLRKYNPPK